MRIKGSRIVAVLLFRAVNRRNGRFRYATAADTIRIGFVADVSGIGRLSTNPRKLRSTCLLRKPTLLEDYSARNWS